MREDAEAAWPRGDQVEMMIMRIVWQCTSTH